MWTVSALEQAMELQESQDSDNLGPDLPSTTTPVAAEPDATQQPDPAVGAGVTPPPSEPEQSQPPPVLPLRRSSRARRPPDRFEDSSI